MDAGGSMAQYHDWAEFENLLRKCKDRPVDQTCVAQSALRLKVSMKNGRHVLSPKS